MVSHSRTRLLPLTALTLIAVVISGCPQGDPAPPAAQTQPTVAGVEPTPVAAAPAAAASVAPSPAPAAAAPAGSATAAVQATTRPLVTSTRGITPVPSAPPTRATATPAGGRTSAATPAAPARVLEARWYQDSDANAIPDFLETEFGADPAVDDCAAQQCGPGGEGSELLFSERNILIMLDSSGSMAEGAGAGSTKMAIAKSAVSRYAYVAALRHRIGFLVYGHQGNSTEAGKAASCAGIETLIPIDKIAPEAVNTAAKQFEPTGWTPIAAALTRAGETFHGKEGQVNRIYLVSDGIETCDGDPVAVAQRLSDQSGLAIEVNVIGFGIAESAAVQQMRRIAEVTGGTYHDAKTAADLNAYFEEQAREVGRACDAGLCEVRNVALLQICDDALVLKSTARMRQLAMQARPGSVEADGYRRLGAQIQEQADVRRSARQEAAGRLDALQKLCAELREQLRRALSGSLFGP